MKYMNFGLEDLMNGTTFGIPNEELKKFIPKVRILISESKCCVLYADKLGVDSQWIEKL